MANGFTAEAFRVMANSRVLCREPDTLNFLGYSKFKRDYLIIFFLSFSKTVAFQVKLKKFAQLSADKLIGQGYH